MSYRKPKLKSHRNINVECGRKVAYVDRQTAEFALSIIPPINGENHIYKCSYCNKLHIGRKDTVVKLKKEV